MPVTNASNGEADASTQLRSTMAEYWQSAHGAPTLNNMMLDDNAAKMDRAERPEILSQLPGDSWRGKDVLELGAGIGRFTAELAQHASSVVAVDFVEASCRVNEQTNKHFPHIKVVCADVTKIDYPPNSFDLVFSNWLLMYLSDEEVAQFAENALKWVKPGGCVFFRESCFHQSGNVKRSFNPTQYRHPKVYYDMFSAPTLPNGERLLLVRTSSVDTYVRLKDNVNQLWWCWRKMDVRSEGRLIQFYELHQYTAHAMLRYEKIYGPGFATTGGDVFSSVVADELQLPRVQADGPTIPLLPHETEWSTTGLTYSLPPPAERAVAAAAATAGGACHMVPRVLDIGCGLGGTLFHLAKTTNAYVHGCDIFGFCVNRIMERWNRAPPDVRERISTEVCDVFRWDPPPSSFTAVILRDFFMHLSPPDKATLFTKIRKWLVQHGRVLVTDYCLGRPIAECSAEFQSYVKQRNYHLMEPANQRQLLEDLGFKVERVRDDTEWFAHNMTVEEARISQLGMPESTLTDEALEVKLGELRAKIMELTAAAGLVGFEETAADGAAENIKKLRALKEADVKLQKEDYEWAIGRWQTKLAAIRSGDLKWCSFTCVRS